MNLHPLHSRREAIPRIRRGLESSTTTVSLALETGQVKGPDWIEIIMAEALRGRTLLPVLALHWDERNLMTLTHPAEHNAMVPSLESENPSLALAHRLPTVDRDIVKDSIVIQKLKLSLESMQQKQQSD